MANDGNAFDQNGILQKLLHTGVGTDGNAIAAARNIAERLDGADVNRALCKLSGAGLFCINVRAARKKVK